MEYSLPRDGDLRKIVSKRKNEAQSPIPNGALCIVPPRAHPRPGRDYIRQALTPRRPTIHAAIIQNIVSSRKRGTTHDS